MARVHLSPDEELQGALTGVLRHWSARRDNRKDNAPGEDKFRIDIQGACAEIAGGKFFNCHWRSAVGRVDCADLGDNIEIRWRSRPDGELPVYPENDDNSVYVLAINDSPDIELVGWIWGRDAKRDYPLRSLKPGSRAAHWVPQSALNPMPERKESDQ